MEGNLDDCSPTKDGYGVIPRSAEQIFTKLETDPNVLEYNVYCSFLEIYNEELCDLLVSSSSSSSSSSTAAASGGGGSNNNNNKPQQQHPKLVIMDGPDGRPFCRGLSERHVENSDELLRLMRQAQQQRQVGETNMNKQSSRSHCIFTLRVDAKRRVGGDNDDISRRGCTTTNDGVVESQAASVLEVSGKLHCVDLAGSECAKSANLDNNKTSADNQAARERERMNINRSLLTLGRVVSTLKDISSGKLSSKKNNNVRIPYRDSKLTRILQESLGGRCKTCLIATVSPSVTAIEESLSTLNYAQAANGIINKPITTSSMTMLGGTTIGVGSLSSVGAASAGASAAAAGGGGAASVEHWQEMEVRLQYMQSQVDEAQQALARKHIQHQEFLDRAEKAEADLKQEQELHQLTLVKIDELQDELVETKNRATHAEKQLKETKVLLDATRQTEVSLTKEASELLNHLKATIEFSKQLHSELVEGRDDDINRRDATKVVTTKQIKLLEDVVIELARVGEKQKTFHSNLSERELTRKKHDMTKLDHHLSIIEALKSDCQSQLETIRTNLHTELLQSSFQPFIESVRESLAGLHNSTKDIHDDLHQHCQELHDGLDGQLTELKTYQESSKSKSDDLKMAVENHFESARTMLEQNVSTSIEAHQRDLSQRNKLSEDALTSLQSWKTSCDDCIADVKSITGSNLDQLKATVSSFADECSERREGLVHNFETQLVDQLKRREKYIKMLEEQNRHLQEQHDVMVKSKAEQERRNELLMTNVMSKVQETLQHEMDSMRTFQQEQFTKLSETNSSLNSTNETLSQTTNNTFDVLDSNVSKLSNESKISFDLQDRFCRDLTNEVKTFGSEVDESLPKHQDSMDRHAQESIQAIQSACVQDKASSDAAIATIQQELESNKESFSSDSELIRSRLVDLNNSSNDVFSFVVTEIVEPTQAAIEKNILDLICEGRLTAHSQADGIEKLLSTGQTIMEDETNRQIQSTNRLGETINDAISQKFQPSINEHKSKIDEDGWLKNSVNMHATDFEKTLDSISSKVDFAKGHTEDLATNIIKVDDDVPPVMDLTTPAYSTALSATPSDEEVLQGLLAHDDDACDAPAADIESSHENENIPPTKSSSSRNKQPTISSTSIPVLTTRPSSHDETNIVGRRASDENDDGDDDGKEATKSSPGHKRPVQEDQEEVDDEEEVEVTSSSTSTLEGSNGAETVLSATSTTVTKSTTKSKAKNANSSSRNKRARTAASSSSSSIPSSK